VERAAGLAIVDLPGYGFARASKQERAHFAAAVERYLHERKQLRGLVLLLDVRRAPQEEEEMLVHFAAERGIGLVRVATKIDKLGRGERVRRLTELAHGAGGPWLAFSAVTGEGRDALARAVTRLRDAQMENDTKL